MKKLYTGAMIAAVLMLAGCASQAAPEPAAVTVTVAPTPEDTAEALAAPSPTDAPYGDYTQDEYFAKAVEATWRGALPPVDELAAAGHSACDAMRAGVAKSAVSVLTNAGDDPAWNNENVAYQASYIYCPEVG